MTSMPMGNPDFTLVILMLHELLLFPNLLEFFMYAQNEYFAKLCPRIFYYKTWASASPSSLVMWTP
jgi:hypothetical protein